MEHTVCSWTSVHIIGKGRRERVLPLWKETAAAVKVWLKVRPASAAPELFLNARAQAMTRSGFEYILEKHVATAARKAPSIAAKGVSPHEANRLTAQARPCARFGHPRDQSFLRRHS